MSKSTRIFYIKAFMPVCYARRVLHRQSIPARAKETGDITYQVGKMTFIVTPVYREDSGKTIHDILLNLMKKDGEKH